MQKLLLIAVGGAIGAVLRAVVSDLATRVAGDGFPFGTLIVNVVGCAAIGFLGALVLGDGPISMREDVRAGILVGLLGGLTTYSTFSWETMGLLEEGLRGRALANVLANTGLALVAVLLGARVAQRIFGL
ncbi:MAG: fluoride efflux transporter CrcB [Planctomycetota bacterium]